MRNLSVRSMLSGHYNEVISLKTIGLAFIVLFAYGLGYVILHLRWTYLVGFLSAAGLLYLTVVLRRFEIALVIQLAISLVIVDALLGWWDFYGTWISCFDFALVALLLTFIAVERCGNKADSVGSTQQRTGLFLKLFLTGYAISFFLSSIACGQPVDIRSWVNFALQGYVLFALTAQILRNENRLHSFAIALLLFGLLISLNENGKVFGFPGFIPWRWASRYVELGSKDITKMGLTTKLFAPAMGWPSRAACFFISFLPLAIAYALQEKRRVLRMIAAITAISLLLNIIALRDRGSWAAAILSLFVLAFFISHRRRFLITITIVGISAFLTLFFAGRLTFESSISSVREWVGEFFASGLRLRVLQGVPLVLPHVPLFGLGWAPYAWTSLYSMHAPSKYVYMTQPHNSYLQLLFTAGPLPLISLTAFMVCLGWKTVTALRKREDDESRTILVAILAGVMALSAESLFDNSLWIGPLNALFWVYTGTMVAIASSAVGSGWTRLVASDKDRSATQR